MSNKKPAKQINQKTEALFQDERRNSSTYTLHFGEVLKRYRVSINCFAAPSIAKYLPYPDQFTKKHYKIIISFKLLANRVEWRFFLSQVY